MVELDLKKLAAPDFTASIRPGLPALVVLNEDAVPKTYWDPGEPRLRRQVLAYDLKGGAEVEGATLSNPEPVLRCRWVSPFLAKFLVDANYRYMR